MSRMTQIASQIQATVGFIYSSIFVPYFVYPGAYLLNYCVRKLSMARPNSFSFATEIWLLVRSWTSKSHASSTRRPVDMCTVLTSFLPFSLWKRRDFTILYFRQWTKSKIMSRPFFLQTILAADDITSKVINLYSTKYRAYWPYNEV